MDEQKKLEKMKFLGETLRRCINTDPALELKDIAVVLYDEIPDMTEFLKHYKKEVKKDR